MPLLRTKTSNGPYSQSSNYAGDDSGTRLQVYEQDIGSGVQKRVNWRRLPQPARSSPVAYDKSWEKENRGTWTRRHTESGPGGTSFYYFETGPYTSSLFPTNSEVPGAIDEAQYAAKVKLFKQLKGEGANLANMLGERKQVAKSIGNALNTLIYAVRDLRRGNISSAVRRFGGDPLSARKLKGKDIANQWLSLQYGWKPILSDVYDLVNGLHVREDTGLMTFRCSSRFERKASSDSSWAFSWWGMAEPVNHGIRSTTAIRKYMIRARPNLVLAEPAALGFTNPLTVAWEVTPWSFVADWFLPVGRYLEQLTADHGWTFYDGCVSSLVKSSETASYSRSRSYTSGGWTYNNSISLVGANSSYVRFDRAGLTAFPIPDAPQFRNPFSVDRVLNSIALLSQVVAGRKGRV